MAIGNIRGPGINLYPQGSQYSLGAGETQLIPAGVHIVSPGPYTFVQWYDGDVTGIWRNIVGNSVSGNFMLNSDGVNFRLANLTGTAIGAVVTNAGSGYTGQPAITASAGASTWTAVIGGLISTTITITTAGAYAYPPILVIPPPTNGGVQARAHVSSVSGGGITTVVVDAQGGGYTTAPPVYIFFDPRDTASAGGGVLTTTLTGSGTLAAVLCTNQGTPQTSVPTLSFTGGGGSSAAATVLGVYTATTVTWATPTHGGNGNFGIISSTFPGLASAAYTQPDVQNGLFLPRQGFTTYVSTAAPTTTVIIDGGLHQGAPGAVLVSNSDGTFGAANVPVIDFGGVTDVSFVQRI